MSYDSYDDRRHRSDRRRRERPAYREEEIVEARTGPRPSRHTELIRRRSDSVEEVEREFPPDDAYIQRRATARRARSDGRGRHDDYRDKRHRNRRYDDRGGTRRKDYSSSSSSQSRPRHNRRKSLGEQALAALGLAGAAAAAGVGHRSRSRDRGRGGDRHRRRSYSGSRSRSRGGSKKIQQAVTAAITAGAAEAFHSRNEPGGWTGEKGKRIFTAALGAGGIDGFRNKDPDKRRTLHTIEAVLGGLTSNRIINGPRDRSASRSRSRSRSRGGGGGGKGLKGLAAGGLAAAAGKALLDSRSRSKSRGRRSYSSSSDSHSPPRPKKRSKSVSEYVSKGIAALGLGEAAKDKGRDDYRDSRHSRRDRDRDYDYDDYDNGYQGRLRGGGGDGGDGIKGDDDTSSDYISSSEDELIQKKMRGKEFLTAGLASVATIHAAHSIYKSVDARKKRSKLVRDGEMSPEEAHKLKNKGHLQDAAAVGFAALGIKGVLSEWKEMKEQRDELHEFTNKREERHEKRLRALEDKVAAAGEHGAHHQHQPRPYQDTFYDHSPGPKYQDGNPYHTGSALPPPPMGP